LKVEVDWRDCMNKIDVLSVMVALIGAVGVSLGLLLLYILTLSIYQYYGMVGSSIAGIGTLLFGTIFLIFYKHETK